MNKHIIIPLLCVFLASCITYFIGENNGMNKCREERILELEADTAINYETNYINIKDSIPYVIIPNETHKRRKMQYKNPKSKYIITEKNAAEFAYVIGKSIYGDSMNDEMPLQVHLVKDSIWIIEGTFNHPYSFGGVMHIEMLKNGGTILEVTHGK